MRTFHPDLTTAHDAATLWGALPVTSRSSESAARIAACSSVTRLGPEHETQFLELLLALDRASRIARFGHPISDASIIAYGKRALSTAAFVAGVFADDRVRGVVEVFEGNDRKVPEVAFVVLQDWRRRGYCLALLAATTLWAQQSGATTLRLIISRCNWPMRRLAEKVGARFDLSLDEICADFAVPEQQRDHVAA
jgi:RimJ/RimL family protein N-acetyltransferase